MMGIFARQKKTTISMKNLVSRVVFGVVAVLSMQSCVTNYVVADPTLYTREHKSGTNMSLAEIKRLEEDKKILLSSFTSESTAKMQAVNKLEKNAEIAKAIKFAKAIDAIIDEAYTYLGTPYRFGGTSRSGIDCSAFVLSVFGSVAGMNLPRVASAQAQEGEHIGKEDLQRGDLIFFSHRGSRIGHVGIVESITPEGEVKFIHAATSRGVIVSSLNDSYWGPRYRMAKRVLNADIVNSVENFARN